MTINTANYAKALYPGVKQWYGLGYNEHPTEYTDLFDSEKSTRAYEEIMSESGLGLLTVKPEGNSITYDSARQGYLTRFNNITYGLGFIVTREMFEDDQYGRIAQIKATALGKSVRQTRETVAANVYNRAFNSTYTGADGVEMCSTAHTNVAGGTFANELTTAADLSEASLEQACIDIMKLTDDRGLKMAFMPESLIIPVDLVFEAERILNSPARPGTADNDLNALRAKGKFPKGIKPNHYLTDADAWFIRTNTKGLMHFERRAPEFTMDNDFDTENAKYKATYRDSFGWSDPRAIFGSPGA